MFHTTNKTGKPVTLLNPAEKAQKYSLELKHRIKITNDGDIKQDKNGRPLRLKDTQAAYRAGYLSARKDSAKAYNSNQRKTNGHSSYYVPQAFNSNRRRGSSK